MINTTPVTLTYLGKQYTITNSISFIKAVRETMIEDKDIDIKLFSLKTLKEFYDIEIMKQKDMIELILPSYDLADAYDIKKYVALNQDLYRDMVVVMYYPREIELIVMPLLYLSSKAVIAKANNSSNNGICVYSRDNTDYVLGNDYTW